MSEMRNTEVKVTNARYDYENAQLNLEKMKVKAPFDGVIVDLPHYTTDIRVEQGKPVVSLMAYDKMYMDINLPESSIRYVKEAQPVYITHYTIPGDTLRGKISELSPAISPDMISMLYSSSKPVSKLRIFAVFFSTTYTYLRRRFDRITSLGIIMELSALSTTISALANIPGRNFS